MDKLLEKQLQSYVPPAIMQASMNDRTKYEIAKYIIDREFKHKPQRWKTVAFPEYDDFFQAAFVGFNPYKTSPSRDKGVLQAIESYNPYKKHEEETNNLNLLIQNINGIAQACCPLCRHRGETVSLWPHSAGNNTVESALAPEPVFHSGNKYCGREIAGSEQQLVTWEQQGLIKKSARGWHCNYSNRLASLKNHISKQLGYLVQDIRSQEYHASRSLKRHPHYSCPVCHTLVPDFNTSSTKTVALECTKCSHTFNISSVKEKVWKSRGSASLVSLQDSYGDEDSKGTYEDVITSHDPCLPFVDPAVVYAGSVEEKIFNLIEDLLDRVRKLAASCIGQKQYAKLLADPHVVKDKNGVPETLNFQIFYNYFFTDDPNAKIQHLGRAKNAADETSTYRELALKFLKKEQHYTQCQSCRHKMYEPTESAKFKRVGARQQCEQCSSTAVQYHGPKCGRLGSNNPQCKDHGEIEIVMYIFQTIEPKIRRLEKLVQQDAISQQIYEQIQELYQAREQLDSYAELARILNY